MPNLLVWTGSILEIFKINQSTLLSIEFPDIFFSCPNSKGKKGLFWKGAIIKRRGTTFARLKLGWYKTWKVSPFVKSEIILPLLCFLLDPLTNKHCRTWSSMMNLWISSITCQKKIIFLSTRPRFNYKYLELSKENVLSNMTLSHWSCFTWKFFTIWFHQSLKLILKAAMP